MQQFQPPSFPKPIQQLVHRTLYILPGSDKEIRYRDEYICTTRKIIPPSPPNCHINIFVKGHGRRMYSVNENARQKRKYQSFTQSITENHKQPYGGGGARNNVFPAPDLFSVVIFQVFWLNGYFQPRRSPRTLDALGIALLGGAFIRN